MLHALRSLALLSLLLLTLSCTSERPELPQLSVSIAPIAHFVRAIAGSDYAVNTLVPHATSPETYEPTPAQMLRLGESRAYFSIGLLPFEQQRIAPLLPTLTGLRHVALADSISLLPLGADAAHAHQHEGEAQPHGPNCQHGQGTADLHIWTSPATARQMVRTICHTLCQLDSTQREGFCQRSDSLLRSIDSLDAEIGRALAPLRGQAFLIYHPALAYFAAHYGLEQIAIEHEGKEPSAQQMQALTERVRREGIRTLFIQQEHEGRAAQRIAEATGIRVASIAPLSEDWPQSLRTIAAALAPEAFAATIAPQGAAAAP